MIYDFGAMFMCKAKKAIIPENILALFENRKHKYHLRGIYKQLVRTNVNELYFC